MPSAPVPKLLTKLNEKKSPICQKHDDAVEAQNKTCFHILPSPIWIHAVFPYMFIEDILRLRRTCRYLNKVTRSPCLWESFLKQLRLPLPVLRPTYSLENEHQNIVSSEVERLVARAVSLDFNFRSSAPTVLSVNRLFQYPGFTRVKILPGGRHVLASWSDYDGPGGPEHGLMLYDLDSPKHPGSTLVAGLTTESQVIDIDAKYAWCGGVHGIFLAFIERKHAPDEKDETSQCCCNVKSFHTTECPLTESRCVPIFVRLDVFEVYSRPNAAAAIPMDSIVSRGQPIYPAEGRSLSSPDVFMWEDRLAVAVMHGTDEILMQDPFAIGSRVLVLPSTPQDPLPTPSGWRVKDVKLRAFRVVPLQSSLEIVRIVTATEETEKGHKSRERDCAQVMEVTVSLSQLQLEVLRGRTILLSEDASNVSHFTISQPPTYFREGIDHPDILRHPRCGPVPISIYGETPFGIVHHTIWPKCYNKSGQPEEPPSRQDVFCCLPVPKEGLPKHLPKHIKPLVLPGGDRAIVLAADAHHDGDDESASVLDILRYVNPVTPCHKRSLFSRRKVVDEELPLAPNATRKELPKKKLDYVSGVPYVIRDLMCDRGVVHADWDEAGGRIALILNTRPNPEIVLLNLGIFGDVDTGVAPLDDDDESSSSL